jgi:hypothetical protein
MSYFIRIFCRVPSVVTRREIAEFVLEGSYFDPPPEFEPTLDALEDTDDTWNTFLVHYGVDRRPLVLTRDIAGDLLRRETEELVFILKRSRQSAGQKAVLEHLQNTTQVISIELDRDKLPKDAWEMLDNLESYLAKRLTGLVYAPDGGFFDEGLRRVYRL